jgi:hypothetical protein
MSAPAERELVLVVGAGRSGTSLLTGILGQLGCRIPQPEVKADDTNPRGFGEPRWVVDFHTRLLRGRRVTVNDSRPAAWESTGAAAGEPEAHDALRAWLDDELAAGGTVVVKDPRTVWFLALWTRVAGELGVTPSFVTTLRHPAETLASARKSYGDWQSPASRAAAWINLTVETEHLTRDDRRAFVRYEDLLADWSGEVNRIGGLLALPGLTGVDPARFPEADAFVDPTLHRNRVGWEDVDGVPERVQALAERVWQDVQQLARPGGDGADARARLDASRAEFRLLYAEAEAIAQSSITAARPRKRQAGPAAGRQPKPAPVPPSLRVRVARRIPKRYRRRVREALRRLPGSR